MLNLQFEGKYNTFIKLILIVFEFQGRMSTIEPVSMKWKLVDHSGVSDYCHFSHYWRYKINFSSTTKFKSTQVFASE